MLSGGNEALQQGPPPQPLPPIILDPTKVNVHVSTLGHVDHGKTTLTAAITRVLAQANETYTYATFEQIHAAPEERLPGVTIACSEVEYGDGKRQYIHADYPAHADCIKSMITGLHPIDMAILVISALDGPQPQTLEHVHLARQVDVPALVVFLNKVDQMEDEELLDVVELEVRELLARYQFPDGIPIVRGSALKALESQGNLSRTDPAAQCIWDLIDRMNAFIPTSIRAVDKPFLMPVENMFALKRGIVVVGRITRGMVKVGDSIEVVGMKDEAHRVAVTGLEMFEKTLKQAEAGDYVGCLLSGVERNEYWRGQVLAQSGSIKPQQAFKAHIYVLSKEEGGRHTPFITGYRSCYYMYNMDFVGEVMLPDDVERVMPGDTVEIKVKLTMFVAMEKGTRFAIREGGRVVCVGVCTKVEIEAVQGIS